jgi:copper(I)-binding protein
MRATTTTTAAALAAVGLAIVAGACGADTVTTAPAITPGLAEVHVISAEVTPDRAGDAILTFAAHNAGAATDTLVAASCTCAEAAELVGDGSIEPQATGLFNEDGPHVVLRDLEGGLRVGDGVDVTLTFEQAGEVDLTAEIAR